MCIQIADQIGNAFRETESNSRNRSSRFSQRIFLVIFDTSHLENVIRIREKLLSTRTRPPKRCHDQPNEYRLLITDRNAKSRSRSSRFDTISIIQRWLDSQSIRTGDGQLPAGRPCSRVKWRRLGSPNLGHIQRPDHCGYMSIVHIYIH